MLLSYIGVGLFAGVVGYFIATRIQKNKNEVNLKNQREVCSDMLKDAELSSGYKSDQIKSLDNLLFYLADFMHNSKVFDVCDQKEITFLFTDARMLSTRYGADFIDAERINEFIEQRLKNELLPKLYPGYYVEELAGINERFDSLLLFLSESSILLKELELSHADSNKLELIKKNLLDIEDMVSKKINLHEAEALVEQIKMVVEWLRKEDTK